MTTTNLGLPLITGNLTADVVRDLNALAEAVDLRAAKKTATETTQQDLDTLEETVTKHLADNVSAHGINLKANKTQEAWISATLINGWTGSIQYAKNDLGLVTFTMYASGGIVSGGTVIATLPVGYRPKTTISSILLADTSFYTKDIIIIYPDGQVALANNSTIASGLYQQAQITYFS